MNYGVPFNPYRLYSFAQVPNWLCRRPNEGTGGLTPGAKLAYGRLMQFAGKDGRAYPYIDTLAREIGVSPRQAKRYIEELVGNNLIDVHHRKISHQSSVYTFLTHEWMDDDTEDPDGEFGDEPEAPGAHMTPRKGHIRPQRGDTGVPSEGTRTAYSKRTSEEKTLRDQKNEMWEPDGSASQTKQISGSEESPLPLPLKGDLKTRDLAVQPSETLPAEWLVGVKQSPTAPAPVVAVVDRLEELENEAAALRIRLKETWGQENEAVVWQLERVMWDAQQETIRRKFEKKGKPYKVKDYRASGERVSLDPHGEVEKTVKPPKYDIKGQTDLWDLLHKHYYPKDALQVWKGKMWTQMQTLRDQCTPIEIERMMRYLFSNFESLQNRLLKEGAARPTVGILLGFKEKLFVESEVWERLQTVEETWSAWEKANPYSMDPPEDLLEARKQTEADRKALGLKT